MSDLEFPAIPAIAGFRQAATASGIKVRGGLDLMLVAMDRPTAVAGVLTRNQVQAAPVQLCRERLPGGVARALVVNSGNANAATGPSGLATARTLCEAVAEALSVPSSQVFPGSTGVIGQPLPVARAVAAIPGLVAGLAPDQWLVAEQAIMTTDRFPKGGVRQLVIDHVPVTLAGIAKGAGMIRPDLATMLGYLFTDAVVTPSVLQVLLQRSVEESFNSITVDGDTSTNDTVLIFASQAAGHARIEDPDHPALLPFASALTSLCRELAQAMVQDGEGATRMISVTVTEARNREEAKQIGMAVANSPLVKTACFGGDPNWGRILAAVGYAGVPIDLSRLRLFLGEVLVVAAGEVAPGYTEEQGQAVMREREIPIRIALGLGDAAHSVWGSDLSYDYVRINADYRS